jgi:hypothetical protein
MKKLGAILIVAAAAAGGWRLWHGPAATDDSRGRGLFYGRAWLDHAPQGRTDKFRVFGTSRGRKLGWFAERSMWKGEWEQFQYEPRGDGKIELMLPHSGKRLRLGYRAWECNEKGFDYCLELSGAEGPTRYYSRRGWEKDRLDDATLTELLEAPR